LNYIAVINGLHNTSEILKEYHYSEYQNSLDLFISLHDSTRSVSICHNPKMEDLTALKPLESDSQAALQNALSLWADSTTRVTSLRRGELIHDKQAAVSSFFIHVRKHPAEVIPLDVRSWRLALEAQGLKPATVYARISPVKRIFI
jgi:hypothetical protein